MRAWRLGEHLGSIPPHCGSASSNAVPETRVSVLFNRADGTLN